MEKLSGKAKGILAWWFAGAVVVFLKVANVIDWPWVWVTAPIWGPFAVFYVAMLVAAVTMVLARFFGWISKHL